MLVNPNNFRITDTPRRASLYYSQRTDKIPPGMPKREARIKFRVAFFGILGMVIIYSVMSFWIFVVEPAVTNAENQYHYGDNKIAVAYLNVGHGGVSEFISFENNQNQVEVIEITGQKHTVYYGTILSLPHQVVTVAIDPSSNPTKPNLIVNVVGLNEGMELFNTPNGFSWTNR